MDEAQSVVPNDLLDRIVFIDRQRAELDSENATLKKERLVIEEKLLELFGDNGLSKLTRNGVTIFVRASPYAKAKDGDKQRAAEVLAKCDLGHFVTEQFNIRQITAYVKERAGEGEALPVGFEDGFELGTAFKIITKR